MSNIQLPKVSIIIPVFNTKQEYLIDCFKSIKDQLYTNLEVIIIDDGSLASTAEFLDKYIQDLNFWYVEHSENGGVSRARNRGIEISSGDYVLFVDSDDAIKSETIAAAVKLAQEESADVVMYGLEYCDSTLSRVDYVQDYTLLKVPGKPFGVSDIDASGVFIMEQLHPQPVNKLIKRSLLINNEIKFPLGIHIGEDHVFSFLVYINASRMTVIDEPFYKYRVFPESSMGNAYKHPTDVINAFKIIRDVMDQKNLLFRWSGKYVDFIISNLKYNRWCFGDHYDEISKLFSAGLELIDSIEPKQTSLEYNLYDETRVGLLLAKNRPELLKDFYRAIYIAEQTEKELRSELYEIDRNYALRQEEVGNKLGVKQAAYNLKDALGRRFGL